MMVFAAPTTSAAATVSERTARVDVADLSTGAGSIPSAYGTPNLYSYDRLDPETVRVMLLNALGIGLIGIILSSDSLRRSFAELGGRITTGVFGRYPHQRVARKETYEG